MNNIRFAMNRSDSFHYFQTRSLTTYKETIEMVRRDKSKQ